ncbi:MAG TPA: hypothetical protein GX706_03500 [Candidatus Moranbacteria bacterium]|nr:hypothetical protein [Candidatus Moranbacteria bacterium]
MKFRLPIEKFTNQPTQIVRRAGYFRIFDSKTGHESFIRKLTADRYPRFHLYLMEEDDEIIFDLHLDQRATRYEGQTAHNADYESEEVRTELTRIYSIVKQNMKV